MLANFITHCSESVKNELNKTNLRIGSLILIVALKTVPIRLN